MNNQVTTLIHEYARRTSTQLTDDHFSVLEYAYEYYDRNRVGPLFPNIQRNTGATKERIETIFPRGLNSVYTWVGIPIASPDETCKPLARVAVDKVREVYLDHNATTYVRDEVAERLVEHFQALRSFGNPSSSTDLGKLAYDLVRKAREQVAEVIGVSPFEIVFTGCGSEANNMAIKGVAFGLLGQSAHFITTKIEHPSVLKTFAYLETLEFDVTYVGVGSDGCVDAESIREALRPETVLVSVMAVNNEIGTINPLEEIGAICREAGVPFMVDAIQGFGKIPLRPKEWGISMLSVSGHKLYAPKGIAALYLSDDMELVPLIHGGSQESGKRAGTEDTAAIMALGFAAELIEKERESEHQRLTELRDYFLERLKEIEPDAVVNGCMQRRIPHNLNIGFPNVDSGSVLLSLNLIGVYVSSGSACSAGSVEASYVLKALGLDTSRYGTVRFSFGKRTTKDDLDYLFQYLPEILNTLREEEAKRAEAMATA